MLVLHARRRFVLDALKLKDDRPNVPQAVAPLSGHKIIRNIRVTHQLLGGRLVWLIPASRLASAQPLCRRTGSKKACANTKLGEDIYMLRSHHAWKFAKTRAQNIRSIQSPTSYFVPDAEV
jgi:hypothetical protein